MFSRLLYLSSRLDRVIQNTNIDEQREYGSLLSFSVKTKLLRD